MCGRRMYSIRSGSTHSEHLLWTHLVTRYALDVESLQTAQTQVVSAVARQKLQRQYTHPYKIASMDALEAFGNDGAHPQQAGPLGCPIAARPSAILLAGKDDERCSIQAVPHRRLVDR